jgi:small subunit ribosomal protein S4e
MTKSHLKRLSAPNTWKIDRKKRTFIIRPEPGSHKMNLSISLKSVLIQTGKAVTLREVTYMLHNHQILVDSRKRSSPAFPVGLFDIVSMPEINEAYTIVVNTLGKLTIKKLNNPKSDVKLIKIKSKRKIKGNKIQIETICGRNVLADEKEAKNYKTGDSLMIKLPEQKILDHKKFEKGATVYLTAGSHVGLISKVKSIDGNVLICSNGKQEIETKTKFAFVIVDEVEKLLKTEDK